MNNCTTVFALFMNLDLDHIKCHHGNRGCPFFHSNSAMLRKHLLYFWNARSPLSEMAPINWKTSLLVLGVDGCYIRSQWLLHMDQKDYLFIYFFPEEHFDLWRHTKIHCLNVITSNLQETIENCFCELTVTSTFDLQLPLVSVNCTFWCNSLTDAHF